MDMAWNDDELLTGVNKLYDYHKYWKSPGVVSPKADSTTKRIMDLKEGPSCPKYAKAVEVFSKRILAALKLIRDDQLPQVGVVVPKSKKGEVSDGLCELMAVIEDHITGRGFQFRVVVNCLERHKTVPSNSKGGARHVKKHFESIVVNDRHLLKNRRVLLLDDVSTTGNTISACRELLQNAGAGDVIMVVIGKTCFEDDDDA